MGQIVEVVKAFDVIIKQQITHTRVRDLLVGAFEGGSNYWYEICRYDYGNLVEDAFHEGGEHYNSEFKGPLHLYLIPFVPGCALVIGDKEAGDDDKTYRLDLAALQKGLELLYRTRPDMWADFIEEDDDSDTADVFLQLCLFGTVVYG